MIFFMKETFLCKTEQANYVEWYFISAGTVCRPIKLLLFMFMFLLMCITYTVNFITVYLRNICLLCFPYTTFARTRKLKYEMFHFQIK